VAFFADEVGCAEGGQHNDAAAKGCRLVGVLSVGRQFGGEQFAILYRHGGEASAIPYARRWSFTLRRLRVKPAMTVKDDVWCTHPTPSQGVAKLHPRFSQDKKAFLPWLGLG